MFQTRGQPNEKKKKKKRVKMNSDDAYGKDTLQGIKSHRAFGKV